MSNIKNVVGRGNEHTFILFYIKICMQLANYNSIAIFNVGLHSYEEMKTLKLKTLYKLDSI